MSCELCTAHCQHRGTDNWRWWTPYRFRHPGICVRKELARGIDLKGDGGYIVVAPSIHHSGNSYQWDGIEGESALLKPAEAPRWVLERARKAPAPTVSQTKGTRAQRPDDGQKWQVGERNVRLASLAGALRKCGLVSSAIETALLEQNRLRCHPPLDTSEVQKISKSIARYPVGNPTAFAPPGYESAFDALWDVIRFASGIPEFGVLMFHVERSLGYNKASDCTSLSQLVGGVFSKHSIDGSGWDAGWESLRSSKRTARLWTASY